MEGSGLTWRTAPDTVWVIRTHKPSQALPFLAPHLSHPAVGDVCSCDSLSPVNHPLYHSRQVAHCPTMGQCDPTLTSTSFPTETLLNPLITSLDGRRYTVPSPLYPTPLTWRDMADGGYYREPTPKPGMAPVPSPGVAPKP